MQQNDTLATETPSAAEVPAHEAAAEAVEFNRSGVMLMWGLFAGTFILPLICNIAAIVVAYLKRGDATTKEELSHFNAGIKTFWMSIIITIVAIPLMFAGIGYFVLFGGLVYFVYRIIRGFIRLSDGREY